MRYNSWQVSSPRG